MRHLTLESRQGAKTEERNNTRFPPIAHGNYSTRVTRFVEGSEHIFKGRLKVSA